MKIDIKAAHRFILPETIFKIFRNHVSEFNCYKKAALDILYPEEMVCVVCGNKLFKGENFGICSGCMELMPLITEPFCRKCGKPLNKTDEPCAECDGVHNYFEQALSVFEYTASVQRLIYRFKYRGEQHLSHVLGALLAKKLKEQRDWDYNVLVAVPLHKKRQRERGFNQSALLASTVAARLNVPVLLNKLERTKETSVQAGLGRQERFANLRQAFHIKDKEGLNGKKIVLVDDIFTTGSTVNECSRVLLEAGAKKVYVVTVATGRPN